MAPGPGCLIGGSLCKTRKDLHGDRSAPKQGSDPAEPTSVTAHEAAPTSPPRVPHRIEWPRGGDRAILASLPGTPFSPGSPYETEQSVRKLCGISTLSPKHFHSSHVPAKTTIDGPASQGHLRLLQSARAEGGKQCPRVGRGATGSGSSSTG